jgi:ankyrin repeat protein
MAAQEDVLALRDAVNNGVVEEVGRLVDKDERLLEARWEDEFTPLTLAIDRGHADVVRLLLGRGADIEASDDDGFTPLYFALVHDQEEVVEVLLDGGADVSRAGPWGLTPLMLAAIQWELGTVQRLLRSLGRRGLNAQTSYGATAFWGACSTGHAETARLLLLEGADHTIARDDGVGARGIAESKGHVECVALIQVRTHT